MKKSVAKFLNELETLRVENVWDKIPYYSLAHYQSVEYKSKIAKLHRSALKYADPADNLIKANVSRIKSIYDKVWDLLNKRLSPAHYNNVVLETELFPLLVASLPITQGNVNQDFLSDLHDLILMREGLLTDFEEKLGSSANKTNDKISQPLIALIYHEKGIQIDSENMDEIAAKHGWISSNSGKKIKDLYNKLSDRVHLQTERERFANDLKKYVNH